MPTRPNPYVGPRSFQTGETLYGRERETLELLDLLIAERIVLLYSPSGAGKTSLIQAALTPKLREEGFNVLPPMRVGTEPQGAATAGADLRPAFAPAKNRFVWSALLSLEEHLPQEKRLPLAALNDMTFDAYLDTHTDASAASPVLIFDQFEEILTIAPNDLDVKRYFFEQIGGALRDRGRWALFSMREDYVAALDPFRRPIPTRFDTTYRLDLLGIPAAREAIQKPACTGDVDFTDAAAQKLVNDLRRVQVQRPDGTVAMQPGPYVEPVQLQVVCFRLWDKLPESKQQIVESDIADVGDVTSALADYYDASVKNVAAASGENERAIREWFDRQLITEQDIRGQVLMEPEHSRGLSNRAIRMFEDAHVVRAEERRGATWFELSHDRLIEPVRASNAAWFKANLSPLQQQADLWNRQGRVTELLLRGKPLEDAELWAKQHGAELTPNEKEFLQESRLAQATVIRERKQNRRIRLLAVGASFLSILALVALGAAVVFALNANAASATARANEQDANLQKQKVVEQERVSKMTSAALSELNVDPEVSLLLATEAYGTTHDVQTDGALRQALDESHVRGTLTGHTDGVNAVAISPDGKFFLTGSADKTARVWDASSGKTVNVLNAGAAVESVAFSPDGKFAVTGSDDNTARLWDLTACNNTGCPLRELKGHTQKVLSAVFSPDGKLIATGSADNSIKLWNAATGSIVQTLTGQKDAINSVAFSPDNRFVLSGSSDGTTRLWDTQTCGDSGCPFKEFVGQAVVWSVAFSPDGKSFVTASDDQNAYKYDVETGSVLGVMSGHSDAVFGIAYSPNGKYIATASRDGTARVWDANTGQLLTVLRGHQDEVYSVAFSPDSQLLLSGSLDKTANLWSPNGDTELRVLRGHLNKVFGADYSGDGKRIITVGGDRTAIVWDAATGSALFPPLTGHTNWVNDGALTSGGTRAATASYDHTIRLWDLTQCNPDCPSTLINAHDDVVWSVTFNADGTRLLSASDDGTAKVWDVSKEGDITSPLLTIKGTDAIYHATFSPDGKFILTANADSSAQVWDAAQTGDVTSPLLTLKGHTALLENASFNADGTLIVTASDDRTARVWDATQRGTVITPLLTLRGHTAPVTAAVFSNDGKFIVTASADKTARIWNAKTGAEESVLVGHTDRVNTVELSPDDRYILTSSSDKTARIALANIDEVDNLAQSRVTRALSCDEWFTLLQEPDFCPGGGIQQNAQNALPTSAPATLVAVVPLPTFAPATPTPEPATDTPEPTATVPLPTATLPPSPAPGNTAAPTPRPAATATPALAPAVYVSRIVFTPLDPPNFAFQVSFVNTVGQTVSYPNWRVLIYAAGSQKSIGDPKGTSKNIAVGNSDQSTVPWKIGVGQCEYFTGQPIWEAGDGSRVPFKQPNGQDISVSFQLCP